MFSEFLAEPVLATALFLIYGTFLIWLFYVPDEEQETTTVEAPQPQPVLAEPTKVIRLVTVKDTKRAELKGLTVKVLRPMCKTAGIEWRNAGDDGKHLKKKEMIDKLIAVEFPDQKNATSITQGILPALTA